MAKIIDSPTPEEIKVARVQAGDTQAMAAARVHSPSYRAWQNWENGSRAMPPAAWELYLNKTQGEQMLITAIATMKRLHDASLNLLKTADREKSDFINAIANCQKFLRNWEKENQIIDTDTPTHQTGLRKY